jgi:hypothetical protein
MDAGVGVSAALGQQNTISTEARRPSRIHAAALPTMHNSPNLPIPLSNVLSKQGCAIDFNF